jgi:hypothetical protein
MFARWLPTVFWSGNLQEGAASCRASSGEHGMCDTSNSVHLSSILHLSWVAMPPLYGEAANSLILHQSLKACAQHSMKVYEQHSTKLARLSHES